MVVKNGILACSRREPWSLPCCSRARSPCRGSRWWRWPWSRWALRPRVARVIDGLAADLMVHDAARRIDQVGRGQAGRGQKGAELGRGAGERRDDSEVEGPGLRGHGGPRGCRRRPRGAGPSPTPRLRPVDFAGSASKPSCSSVSNRQRSARRGRTPYRRDEYHSCRGSPAQVEARRHPLAGSGSTHESRHVRDQVPARPAAIRRRLPAGRPPHRPGGRDAHRIRRARPYARCVSRSMSTSFGRRATPGRRSSWPGGLRQARSRQVRHLSQPRRGPEHGSRSTRASRLPTRCTGRGTGTPSSMWTREACGTPRATPPSTAARRPRTCYDLIEWAGTQPWSNGKVGMSGVSYLADRAVAGGGRATAPPRRDQPLGGGQRPLPGDGVSRRDTGKPLRADVALPARALLASAGRGHGDDVRRAPALGLLLGEQDARPVKVEVPAFIVASWSDQGLHTRGTLEGFKRIGSRHKWLVVHGRKKWQYYYQPENVERLTAVLRPIPEGGRGRGRAVAKGRAWRSASASTRRHARREGVAAGAHPVRGPVPRLGGRHDGAAPRRRPKRPRGTPPSKAGRSSCTGSPRRPSSSGI